MTDSTFNRFNDRHYTCCILASLKRRVLVHTNYF